MSDHDPREDYEQYLYKDARDVQDFRRAQIAQQQQIQQQLLYLQAVAAQEQINQEQQRTNILADQVLAQEQREQAVAELAKSEHNERMRIMRAHEQQEQKDREHNIWTSRATVAVQASNLQQAIQYYSKALEYKQTAEVFYNRGQLYKRLGKYKDAILDFSKCITDNPYECDAYNQRGCAYLYLGLDHKSIDDFECSLKIEEDQRAINAHLLFAKGGYAKAIDIYQSLGRELTNDIDVRRNYGLACLYVDKLEVAIDQFECILDKFLQPADAPSLQIKRAETKILLGEVLAKNNHGQLSDDVFAEVVGQFRDYFSELIDAENGNTEKLHKIGKQLLEMCVKDNQYYFLALHFLKLAAKEDHVKSIEELIQYYSNMHIKSEYYSQLIKIYEKDADNQFILGKRLLELSKESAKNKSEQYLKLAICSLKNAAKNGSLTASYELAFYYSDKSESACYVEQIIASDNVDLIYEMGFACEKSNSTLEKLTCSCYSRAVDLQHPEATFRLAMLYLVGNIAKRAPIQALILCRKAATLQCSGAQEILRLLYMRDDNTLSKDERDHWCIITNQKYTAEQNEEKALANYHYGIMRWLGFEYIDSVTVRKDLSLAANHLEKALNLGNKFAAEALYQIGLIYFNSSGDGQDLDLARTLFVKAKEAGITKANYWLGKIYYHGFNAPINYQQAYEYFQLASKLPEPYDSYYYLGLICYFEHIHNADHNNAHAFFKKVSGQKRGEAKIRIGSLAIDSESEASEKVKFTIDESEHHKKSTLMPSIATNGVDKFIKVFGNEEKKIIYYQVGTKNEEGCIVWNKSKAFGSGYNPSISMNRHNNVVLIYQSAHQANIIRSQAGRLNEQNELAGIHTSSDSHPGCYPSIAIDDYNNVVEFHESQNKFFWSTVYYRIGKFQDHAIDWRKSSRLSSGAQPAVAITRHKDQTFIIHVHKHTASTDTLKLYYTVGRLNQRSRSVTWSRRISDIEIPNTKGLFPSVALNKQGKVLIAYRRSGNNNILIYRTGDLNTEQLRINNWSEPVEYDVGTNASIVFDDSGVVTELHEYDGRICSSLILGI